MPRSFMEIIYIDNDDMARLTGLQYMADTDAETRRLFNSYRQYGVDIKQAKFLLDYHNRRGDLGETIPINSGGFLAITGQQPKSDAAYCKLDADFWSEVMKDRDAAKQAA